MNNYKINFQKLQRSKKGLEVYGIFMVAMTLLLLITIGGKTLLDSSKMDVSLKKIGDIGDVQRSLLDSNYNSQKLLFYLDQSVIHASYQSFYDLAQSGGTSVSASHPGSGGCEQYYGYTVWVGRDACLPTDSNALSVSFEEYVNTELPTYLVSHKEFAQSGYSLFLIPGVNPGDQLHIVGSNPKALITELQVGAGASFNQQVINPQSTSGTGSIDELYSETIADEFLQSPSFKEIKSGKRDIDRIVLHYTAGKTIEGAKNTFLDSSKKVSSHYIVDKDGTILQMVWENDIAWHASGVNSRSIGIEIVNLGFDCKKDAECSKDCFNAEEKCWEKYPVVQKEAVTKLVVDIVQRHPEILVDDEHIISHSSIDPIQKSDPGPAFEITEFIADVEKQIGQVVPTS